MEHAMGAFVMGVGVGILIREYFVRYQKGGK